MLKTNPKGSEKVAEKDKQSDYADLNIICKQYPLNGMFKLIIPQRG